MDEGSGIAGGESSASQASVSFGFKNPTFLPSVCHEPKKNQDAGGQCVTSYCAPFVEDS